MEKIKTIKRHRWHPEEKYWSFPSSNGVQSKPDEKLFEISNAFNCHTSTLRQARGKLAQGDIEFSSFNRLSLMM
jgi:hypothetical protein